MDVAFNQFASAARRKNRSTTNLNHLTLAPLTSKLPLTDPDDLPDPLSAPPLTTSYLEGKSAPTTPRLLSRSPGRAHSHARGASTGAALPKSKSTTHLGKSSRRTGSTSPKSSRRRNDEPSSATERSDTDWLLRAGALISTETRESKGQAWLVSRASSTSLAGVRDPEDDAFERELARERETNSRHTSRRGSLVFVEDEAHIGSSPPHSRFGSRSHSRAGTRSQLLSPSAEQQRRSVDGYFPVQYDEGYVPGPDFVNIDEQLESVEEDTIVDDEAHVRRLVKRGNNGVGTWFNNVLNFQLFSVEENEEESDADGDDDDDLTDGEDVDEDDFQEQRRLSLRKFEGTSMFAEERIPPPKADEGGWHDAAWLLTVATKVLL